MEKFTVNAYSTLGTPPRPDFPHDMNSVRDRSDPELLPHLEGLVGYAVKFGGEMTVPLYALWRHIQRVQTQYSFDVEQENFGRLGEWALKANAVLFLPDGSVRNPHGQIIVSQTEGEADKTALPPYPEDAVKRKARIDEFLGSKGLKVAPMLPPVTGEGEVVLRSVQEVVERALALLAVAAIADALSADSGFSIDDLRSKMPRAFDFMSPMEKEFLEKREEQDVIDMVWRYESLFALLWVLGIFDKLPFPSERCDVAAITEKMSGMTFDSFVKDAKVRDTVSILDELDLHFRLHWIARQAEQEGREPDGNIDQSVVVERHHALNWLVRFEEAEWDNVDVPT